jgi:dihydrofolate reductase
MINLIVAIDEEFGIGKNNSIPWHISEDLKNFKRLTINNVCIMGRNTWTSLPSQFQPLPNRKNIIISKKFVEKPNYFTKFHEVFLTSTLEEAIAISKKLFPNKEIYIIGGSKVYQESIISNLIDKFIVTHVKGNHKASIKLPFIDFSKYKSKEILSGNNFNIVEYVL